MKLSLLFALFAAASVFQATAQDAGLIISPQWKVGDTRTLNFVDVRTDIENGDTLVDSSVSQYEFNVVGKSPTAYILSVKYDGFLFRQTENPNKAFDEVAQGPKKLTLRYSVDRHSGASVLQNWKEVQGFVKGRYDVIMENLKAKDPKSATASELIMKPILLEFDSQKNVQSFFSSVIDPVTTPLGKRLVLGDTLREDQRWQNPFSLSPTDSLDVTRLTSLVRVNRMNQLAEVRTEIRVDLSAYTQAIKGAMGNMMKSMMTDVADKRALQAKMSASIDSIQFDVTGERMEAFDLLTTWPIGAVTSMQRTSYVGDTSRTFTRISTMTVTEFPPGAELAETAPTYIRESDVYVYGLVKNVETPDTIPYATLTYRDVSSRGTPIMLLSSSNGTYKLGLPAGKIYRIDFNAVGKMTKSVEVDLKNVPISFKAGEFAVDLDMTLSDALPDLHASAFDKPIGMCRYDAPTDNMKWDVEYTGKIKAEQDAAMEKYRRKHKSK